VVVICPELPGWTQRILWGPGCPENCVVDAANEKIGQVILFRYVLTLPANY